MDTSCVGTSCVAASVKFKTKFGDIDIQTKDIKLLKDGAITLADGTTLKGTFVAEKLAVRAGANTLQVTSADLTAIAPAGDVGQVAQPGSPQADKRPLLRGKVLNDFGKPLAGVTVAIKDTTLKTTTGDDGTYTLDYVPGELGIEYSKAQYEGERVAMNVAAAVPVPVRDVTLRRVLDRGTLYFFRNEEFIPAVPLPKGSVKAKTIKTELPDGGPFRTTNIDTQYFVSGTPDLLKTDQITLTGDFPVSIYRVPSGEKGQQPFYRNQTHGYAIGVENSSQPLKFEDSGISNKVLHSIHLDPGLYVIVRGAAAANAHTANELSEPCYLLRIGPDVPGDPATQPVSEAAPNAATPEVIAAIDAKYGDGYGPFKFGMNPVQVAGLLHVRASTVWKSMPISKEYTMGDVRYLDAYFKTAQNLPHFGEGGVSDTSYTHFQFRDGKLFSVSLRYLNTDQVPDHEHIFSTFVKADNPPLADITDGKRFIVQGTRVHFSGVVNHVGVSIVFTQHVER